MSGTAKSTERNQLSIQYGSLSITVAKSPLRNLGRLCLAVSGRLHRDLLEFSLALHQENSEVRHRLQRRETGNRSQSHRCCSR